MKTNVTNAYSGGDRYVKRLDTTIKVLVIHRVLITPDPSTGICDFVAHEPDTIVTWVGLDLVYNSPCPSHDGRLHSNGRTNRRKCEAGWATVDGKLPVRSVVIHVTLARMRLAPRILVRGDILGFGKISRAGILRWIEIAHCDGDPMRRASVTVTAMIVRRRGVPTL